MGWQNSALNVASEAASGETRVLRIGPMLHCEHRHTTYRGISCLTLALLAAGCSGLVGREPGSDPKSHQIIHGQLPAGSDIPESEDWIDLGEILSAGLPGTWDHLHYGGFAASVVKRDGTILLYYQGADSYDEAFGTVANRAIGVATSTDGINFLKHAKNPVIRWRPNAWLEEGAVSSAPLLDASQAVWMYYGANSRIDDWNVSADARLAYSADGVTFADVGLILGHSTSTLWGSGDELFPIAAIYEGGDVLLYYLPNGAGRRGKLGVARLEAGVRVVYSSEVKGPGSAPLSAWGAASIVEVAPGWHVLFLNRDNESCIEARLVELHRPDRVSAPLTEYCFGNMSKGTVFLDQQSDTWFLYYRSRDGRSYGVKTAARQLRHDE